MRTMSRWVGRAVPCCALAMLLLGGAGATSAAAQTPEPFPRPGEPRAVPPPAAAPVQPPVAQPPVAQPPTAQPPAPGAAPDEATLGVPIYPGAAFLDAYDAGKGQRFYLFGTNASFTDITNYYRTVLRQKGDLVYDQPAIQQFDIGKFREETMAFPPSVTVKDYSTFASGGYLNPKRGAQPEYFKTIIQIVPAGPEQ